MTRPIFTYAVAPSLPKELECLNELSCNLLWTWDHELLELFMRLDPELWEETNHNPVQMIGRIRQEVLNGAVRDDAFLAQLEHALERCREYMSNPRAGIRRPTTGPTGSRSRTFPPSSA